MMLHKKWATQEFSAAKFKDFRLRQRFIKLMSSLTEGMAGVREKPDSRQSNTFTKGAQRFFMNDRVELHEIFAPHQQATISRMQEESYVLNIQDTSGLNYHKHDSKIDLGHIGSSPNRNDAYGYWLHTGLLVSEEGSPLGISYQELWSRQEWFSDDKQNAKSRNRRLPIEQKESGRWLEGIKACAPYRETKAKIVHVCDREADIYEFFQLCDSVGDAFVVRAKSNRVIEIENQRYKLENFAKNMKSVFEKDIHIQGNSDRKTKNITAKVKVRTGTFLPPTSNRIAEEAKKLGPLELSVIEVSSSHKVEGKPVKWLLITNLPTDCEKMLNKIVDWYALRWRIEIFFKALKSGANIENCRLIDIDRLSKYVLMQSIVAFRVLQLTFFSRMNPKKSIRKIISPIEWAVINKILFKKAGRPASNAAEVTRRIAVMGGFIPGKNRIPGILSIWKGWAWLSVIISEAETLGFKAS